MTRARRTLSALVALALCCGLLPVLVLSAAPAGATGPITTAADSNGNYGYCNVQQQHFVSHTTSGDLYELQWGMRCNYSSVQWPASAFSTSTDYLAVTAGPMSTSWQVGTSEPAQSTWTANSQSHALDTTSGASVGASATTFRMAGTQRDQGGSVRPSFSGERTPDVGAVVRIAAAFGYDINGAFCDSAGHITVSRPGFTGSFQFGCNVVAAGATLDYPAQYWSGGSPGGPPPASPLAPPSYQCQRTLTQASGAWSVQLATLGPFSAPTPSPTTTSEAWSGGYLTAPLNGNQPAAQTLPSAPPVGGWVFTWSGTYQLPADDASHTYSWNVGTQDATRQLLNGATSWSPSAPIPQALNSQQLHDLLAQGSTTGQTWTSGTHTATLSAVGQFGDLAVSVDGTSYGTVLASFTTSGSSTTAAKLRATTDYGVGGFTLPNVVTGASFGADPRALTVSCAVLVDLSQPNTGVQATINPPNSTPPPTSATAPPSGSNSGCSAGPLGSIPLIGGVLDSTAELVCAMGDMLGRLLNGLTNLFLQMFVPSQTSITALQHLWDTVTTKAPFSVVHDIMTALPTTVSAFQTHLSNTRYDDGTEKCPTIDINPAGTSIPGVTNGGQTQTPCMPHNAGSDLNLIRGILLALFAVTVGLAVLKTTQRVINGG